ncbi:dual specificity protein phosphatase family protein [uncultured Cytophaga sp.]|uniref:dual specificity protein phosphatase family protein n=1 Tax=uncultured Cytophaga sp. TaxID=160238 RepID=UPI00263049FC|nr:dual specificity protein phosphatase family protein [uncultured Cytophaga sp.]
MKKIKFVTMLLSVCLLSHGCVIKAPTQNKEKAVAEKISLASFKNLYKIDDSLYRSEQPSARGMKELETLGIKTVLNFRNHHNDKDEVEHTSLIFERIALNTKKITYTDIVQTLQRIKHSKKPILIHCWHGSDRTGCMIAAYRMVYNKYTKEQAIAECIHPQYGYHHFWFPNIIILLNGLDVEGLKRDLGEE